MAPPAYKGTVDTTARPDLCILHASGRRAVPIGRAACILPWSGHAL